MVTTSDNINNLLDLLIKGGVIMIPIVLLSFISAYLFIERYYYIKKQSEINHSLINSVIMELKNGNKDKAIFFVQNTHSSLGRILDSGLEKIGSPILQIESNIETTSNLEIAKMEKNTGYLGVIAGIAPMLGFIGTIAGVIKIFYEISLANNISIGIISSGLYQKMICSGTGLLVGVLAYSAYHILQLKIDKYTINLQETLVQVLKAL